MVESKKNLVKQIEQTSNDRLTLLRDTFETSDVIIAKEMGLGVSSVSSLMTDGGNRKISVDWFVKFEKIFPFVNLDWLWTGGGNMLKNWSARERKNYIVHSEWYKSKPLVSEKFKYALDDKKWNQKDPCNSKEKIDVLLKKEAEFIVIIRERFKKSYGSLLIRSDVNKNICRRIKHLRYSITPKQTQASFAEKLDVKRLMIVSIESYRQNPSTWFITRLKQKLNVNYDWLIDGEGDMFVEQSYENNIGEFKKLKEENEMLKRVVDKLSRT